MRMGEAMRVPSQNPTLPHVSVFTIPATPNLVFYHIKKKKTGTAKTMLNVNRVSIYTVTLFVTQKNSLTV